MRKQTKLVAVLSAAALLAIGVSMTSFAASGWTQEDGTWVYLKSDGERVTEDWRKSGSNYFWLNDDGEMETNAIVDNDTYYVDANGARVTNQWISMENEDNQTIGENDDISTIWYYFGSNGKMNKDGIKTINGKKYIFDGDGYMLSGWQEYEGDLYYLGDENEGWAYTGWQYLEVQENIAENYDEEEWFYFKPSNGRAYKADLSKEEITRRYIDGRYYSFDENGVMQEKWVVATPGSATGDSARYRADDGRQEVGWIYAYPDNEEDGDEQFWYFLDSKGVPFNLRGADSGMNEEKPFAAYARKRNPDKTTGWNDAITGVAAKSIKGKTYLFNNKGEMQTGVFHLVDVARTGGKTLGSTYDEVYGLVGDIYYFNKDSGSGQGAMATGKTTVTFDGDNYNYYFQKEGSAYRNIIVDNTLYDGYGERVDAEDGNSYQLISIGDSVIRIQNSTETIQSPVAVKVVSGDGEEEQEWPATVIVSSSGKVKKKGTVKIEGYKYTVENYVVTKVETGN